MYVCMYAGSIRQCYPTLSDSRVSHLAVIRPYSSLFFFSIFSQFSQADVPRLRINATYRGSIFSFFFLILLNFRKLARSFSFAYRWDIRGSISFNFFKFSVYVSHFEAFTIFHMVFFLISSIFFGTFVILELLYFPK